MIVILLTDVSKCLKYSIVALATKWLGMGFSFWLSLKLFQILFQVLSFLAQLPGLGDAILEKKSLVVTNSLEDVLGNSTKMTELSKYTIFIPKKKINE